MISTIRHTGLLLLGFLILVSVACGDSQPLPDIDATVEAEEIISEGKVLYLANCATCHGVNLQGNPNWRSGTDKDGQSLPPPLNGTGHTWHHSPKVLHEIIKYGLKIYDENYEGKMVGNENLTDKEIYSLLEYIESVWPEELRTNYTKNYK